MRPCLLRVLSVLLLIFASSLLILAQTKTPQESLKTGSVSGRVTIKGKGIGGVAVGLRRADYSTPFETQPRAVTDENGNYKISNVAPNAYITVFGFVGYVQADDARHNVVLSEGENVENIDISLVRGGVITGKITDADGQPLIQQLVRLTKVVPPNPRVRGAQPPQLASSATTDDRGIYRMYGLKSGRYKVSVGRGDNFSFGNMSMPGRASYKEVFYPDATDEANATILEVSEGSETANIDITVGRPMQTFAASGKVVDGEKGQPITNIRFGIQRMVGDRIEFVPVFLMTNALGEFTAEGLIPGKYGVFVSTSGNSELRLESTSFEIIDSDVSGIILKAAKGASISGTVVVENDDKRVLAKLTLAQIVAYVATSPTVGSSSRSPIGGDGSFRVVGLGPGTANLNLLPTSGFDQLKGLTVTRIERDGLEQPRGIEVKDGEDITGVRIFVNYGSATLRGVITIENGPLPPGARISVQLTKPGEQRLPGMRPPTVDERGHFLIDGVPPGSYEVVVFVTGSGLKPHPPERQTVVLQDGIVTDVAFRFDLAKP